MEARSAAVANVGGLPVKISPVTADEVTGRLASAPAKVRVEVLDRAAALRGGAHMALRLSRADGGSGPGKVEVDVDYNSFRHAFESA